MSDSMYPLPKGFSVSFENLVIDARGLTMPECVLSLIGGKLVTSDGNGGHSAISAGKVLRHVLPIPSKVHRDLIPNGIAVEASGDLLSSIAFGGSDRKTAFLGYLLDDCIRSFQSPVAGLKLSSSSRKLRLLNLD